MRSRFDSTSSGQPERHPGEDATNSVSGSRLGAAAVAALALALPGAVSAGSLPLHAGTHAVARADVRLLAAGTRLYDLDFEGLLEPLAQATRMGRVRELAPLPLREWASVFGTSHTTVYQWVRRDPSARPKLTTVLEALERAAKHHGDVALWLRTPLSGTNIRPLDLLREERWRAFDGALRLKPHATLELDPDQLARLRRDEVSWALSDVPHGEAPA